MIVWILRRVEPKYFVIGFLGLVIATLATYSGTRATPGIDDLQSVSGVVEEVYSRCSRGNSCDHYISLRTTENEYTVSLFYCRGAENALRSGDHLRIGFVQDGWNPRGGSAYFIDRRGYLVCSYDDAVSVHEQVGTVNYRIGILALMVGAIAMVAAFVVGAAKGYK